MPTGQNSRSRDLVPLEIRAALQPGEADDFDREFQQVMAEATESLDLTIVYEMLVRWRRVARSGADPEAHRRMLARADQVMNREPLDAEPWREARARLGR